jgi:hypothetical protein
MAYATVAGTGNQFTNTSVAHDEIYLPPLVHWKLAHDKGPFRTGAMRNKKRQEES